MTAKYQYKIVRVGEGVHGIKKRASNEYKKVIAEHAKRGWRLVQVFAPGLGHRGKPRYYEVILEREEEESPAGPKK